MAQARSKAQEKVVEGVEIPDVTSPENQQMERRRAVDNIVPEVMRNGEDYDEDALLSAETFADFERLTREAHGDIQYAPDVLGDGFTVLRKEDKSKLVGIPLLFMSWDWNSGDFSRPFVSIRVVARMAGGMLGRFIVNDGGAGIAEQIAKYEEKMLKKTGKRPSGGLAVPRGFTPSDYDKTLDSGETISATTYYIDTSAS